MEGRNEELASLADLLAVDAMAALGECAAAFAALWLIRAAERVACVARGREAPVHSGPPMPPKEWELARRIIEDHIATARKEGLTDSLDCLIAELEFMKFAGAPGGRN